jgi:hypothetical protein
MRSNSEGYWEEKKGKLLKRYKNLTHSDLHFKLGKEQEMIRKLSSKLGKSTQELLRLIVML